VVFLPGGKEGFLRPSKDRKKREEEVGKGEGKEMVTFTHGPDAHRSGEEGGAVRCVAGEEGGHQLKVRRRGRRREGGGGVGE